MRISPLYIYTPTIKIFLSSSNPKKNKNKPLFFHSQTGIVIEIRMEDKNDILHLRRIEGLFNIFVVSVECEMAIENLRSALAQNETFIPEHLFFYLIKKFSSNLAQEDSQIEYCTLNFETVLNLLSQYGYISTISELIKVFSFVSENLRKGFSFAEFSKLLLPKKDYQLRQRVLYRKLQKNFLNLGSDPDIEGSFAFEDVLKFISHILFFEIRYFRDIQNVRKLFFDPFSFNPFIFYERIDWKNQGYIGYEDVVSLFLDIKKSVFLEEFKMFLNRIKIGYETDDKTISFKDFINLVFFENISPLRQPELFDKNHKDSVNNHSFVIEGVKKRDKFSRKFDDEHETPNFKHLEIKSRFLPNTEDPEDMKTRVQKLIDSVGLDKTKENIKPMFIETNSGKKNIFIN